MPPQVPGTRGGITALKEFNYAHQGILKILMPVMHLIKHNRILPEKA